MQKESDHIFLLLKGDLTEWERSFLKSVARNPDWSPKQKAIYYRIRDLYLEKEPGVKLGKDDEG